MATQELALLHHQVLMSLPLLPKRGTKIQISLQWFLIWSIKPFAGLQFYRNTFVWSRQTFDPKFTEQKEPNPRRRHRLPANQNLLFAVKRAPFVESHHLFFFFSLRLGRQTRSCWQEPGFIFSHLSARRKPIQRGTPSEGGLEVLEVLICSLSRRCKWSYLHSARLRSANLPWEPRFMKTHGIKCKLWYFH